MSKSVILGVSILWAAAILATAMLVKESPHAYAVIVIEHERAAHGQRVPQVAGTRFGLSGPQLPVPQRRCRKRSAGAKSSLSASRPMSTITNMMPRTWSMACSSRP